MQMKIKKSSLIAFLFIISITAGGFICDRGKTNIESNATINRSALDAFKLPRTPENFPQYVTMLKSFALENGIDKKTIDEAFSDVHYLHRAVSADRNQPEKKLELEQYLKIVASPERIALAKQKHEEHFDDVKRAQELTGVPSEFIIALWGIESRYGKLQGKEDVISALSTLAFEGRREAFFSKELLAALKILEQGHISKSNFKGSWAGAMGQSQFMPSSFLHYGKDATGKGKIDIWGNIPDVLASIGNYLGTVGWQNTEDWGHKVLIPKNFDTNLAGLNASQSKSIHDWLRLGIVFNETKASPSSEQRAWLIFPSENHSEGYLVYPNFRTLMNWNRSYFFAISVGTIADSLKKTK